MQRAQNGVLFSRRVAHGRPTTSGVCQLSVSRILLILFGRAGALSLWGSFIAEYMLAVARCVALRREPRPAAQISALRLPQASRVLRHLQREALCAATALTLHGWAAADPSQSSLNAGMLLCSASHRQTDTAALWVLRPMFRPR